MLLLLLLLLVVAIVVAPGRQVHGYLLHCFAMLINEFKTCVAQNVLFFLLLHALIHRHYCGNNTWKIFEIVVENFCKILKMLAFLWVHFSLFTNEALSLSLSISAYSTATTVVVQMSPGILCRCSLSLSIGISIMSYMSHMNCIKFVIAT